MTSVEIPCPPCAGLGYLFPASGWLLCASCDGVGRTWAPGAPGYDCKIRLADREPGEIVQLGNGDRGRILWHSPRKNKRQKPDVTFIGLIGDFDDVESAIPTKYPSCVGVISVGIQRLAGDADDHAHDHSEDLSDPLQRRRHNLM